MRIAACLIVKNEAFDIAEWIAYHSVIGIDTFLIYDNASWDGTPAALRAAAAVLDVRVIHWPHVTQYAQIEAYDHAIRTFGREFDWIAVLDSDEFLVTHAPHTLRSLCASTPAAAIGISWAIFGSNNHVAMPRSTVIEAFTRRADTSFPAARHIKSIVRPTAVETCLNPHAFLVDGRTVTPCGKDLAWKTLDPDGTTQPGLTQTPPHYGIAQINHYFTRSHEHWARKVLRGYPNPVSREKLAFFDAYDRNEVEDRSALRHLPSILRHRAEILSAMARIPARRIHAAKPASLAHTIATSTGTPTVTPAAAWRGHPQAFAPHATA